MCCRFPIASGRSARFATGAGPPHTGRRASFGFFAPSYQEVRRIDGKFVNTQRPLLFNYVFVRASERDVFH